MLTSLRCLGSKGTSYFIQESKNNHFYIMKTEDYGRKPVDSVSITEEQKNVILAIKDNSKALNFVRKAYADNKHLFKSETKQYDPDGWTLANT